MIQASPSNELFIYQQVGFPLKFKSVKYDPTVIGIFPYPLTTK